MMEIFSNLNPVIYILIVLFFIPVAMIFILRIKKPFQAYRIGCLLFAGCAHWILFYIFELASRSLEFKILWSKIQYIGIASVPVIIFILTLYFSGYRKWFNVKTSLLFAIIPIAAIVCVFTNNVHHLFWRETALIGAGNYFLLEIEYGIAFYIYAFYIYTLLIVNFILLFITLVRKSRLFKFQSIILIAALAISFLSNILYIFRFLPFRNLDITPIAITISSLILTYGMIHFKIGNIIPLNRIPKIDDSKDISIIINHQDQILFVSPFGMEIFNFNLENIIGKHIRETIPEAENFIDMEFNNISKKEFFRFVKEKNEEIFEINMTPLIGNNKSVIGKVFIFKNVTEKIKMQRALEESEKRYRDIFENSLDGIYQSTLDGQYIDANLALVKMLGYASKKELLSRNIRTDIYFSEKDRPDIDARNKPFETRLKKKDGTAVWVEINSRAVEVNGKPEYFEGIVRDINSRKLTEERIKYLSLHDHLTGLYNRYFFEEELIRLDSKRLYPTSIILADINGLKFINDAFGHKKGDEVLIEAAKIFRKCFRKEDIISRWGGDEFCIILPNTDEKTALKIADRIDKRFRSGFIDSFELSLSFGMETKTSEDISYEKIVKIAEDKMFRHKLINKQSTHSNIITSLNKALEERNYETHEHAKRMSIYANLLGKELKLDSGKISELNLLSSLHDIGKISIPDNIVLKPGSLTGEEFELMKKHSEIGYKIAKSTPELSAIAEGILTHHEKWDGTGYPLGLKGEKIPLISRIMAIVDAFDAITSDRPYRKALSLEKAIEELINGSGSQFDKKIVDKFLEILERYDNNLEKISKITI